MPGSSATIWSIAARADMSTMRSRTTATSRVGGAAVETAHPEC
jgi:hypothetical protein